MLYMILFRVVNDYDSDRDSVSDCWRENDRLTGYRRLPAIMYYRAARLECHCSYSVTVTSVTVSGQVLSICPLTVTPVTVTH